MIIDTKRLCRGPRAWINSEIWIHSFWMCNMHMNNKKRTQLAIQIDVLFAFHLMTDDSRHPTPAGGSRERTPRTRGGWMSGGWQGRCLSLNRKTSTHNEVIDWICLWPTTKVVGAEAWGWGYSFKIEMYLYGRLADRGGGYFIEDTKIRIQKVPSAALTFKMWMHFCCTWQVFVAPLLYFFRFFFSLNVRKKIHVWVYWLFDSH